MLGIAYCPCCPDGVCLSGVGDDFHRMRQEYLHTPHLLNVRKFAKGVFENRYGVGIYPDAVRWLRGTKGRPFPRMLKILMAWENEPDQASQAESRFFGAERRFPHGE